MADAMTADALHSLARRCMSEQLSSFTTRSIDRTAHWMDRHEAALKAQVMGQAMGLLDSAYLALEKEARRG